MKTNLQDLYLICVYLCLSEADHFFYVQIHAIPGLAYIFLFVIL
jgi:hypothetical protein